MTESDLHKFLKNIGRAFLFNQRCFIVATEVWLTRIEKPFLEVEGIRTVIDVCGFGEKYIPYEKQRYAKRMVQLNEEEITELDYTQTQYKYNVIRGIEVKISKSDLDNGYIASGCNYHYILVPKELELKLLEIPKHVGILTVDVPAFRSKFETPRNKFVLKGLKTLRPPRFKKIRPWQIDSLLAQISSRCARELIRNTAEYLEAFSINGVNRNVGLLQRSN